MIPDDDKPPVFAPGVRSWAYGIGLVSASFAVAAPEPVARYLSALAAAALAIALGYRPTR